MRKKTEIRIESDLYKLEADPEWLLPEKDYTEHVVGESFTNDDGSSRQEYIKRYAKKGAVVDLEFYTYEGEPAARVLIKDKQIGNLSKYHAKELFRHVKAGGYADIKIRSSKKAKGSENYGVILTIHRYIPQKTKDKRDLLPCPVCGKQIAKNADMCPNCGVRINNEKKDAIVAIAGLQKKSRFTSFVLTLLFGPLGLLYSSVIGGVILIAVALISAPTGIGPVIAWVIAILWGDSATYHYNKKLEKQAKQAAKLI